MHTIHAYYRSVYVYLRSIFLQAARNVRHTLVEVLDTLHIASDGRIIVLLYWSLPTCAVLGGKNSKEKTGFPVRCASASLSLICILRLSCYSRLRPASEILSARKMGQADSDSLVVDNTRPSIWHRFVQTSGQTSKSTVTGS